MIINERMTAKMDSDFVVFLIGMRINHPLRVRRWFSVISAMRRMLEELYAHPELGFMHHETGMGRTLIQVQYWKSMDQLMDYAKARDGEHLPAWRAFNKTIAKDATVGIWHETYLIKKGQFENIYHNMPAFGLGCVGELVPASGYRETARGRLNPSHDSSEN
jgi:hypothetical protein